jgi:hypothetical protein
MSKYKPWSRSTISKLNGDRDLGCAGLMKRFPAIMSLISE